MALSAAGGLLGSAPQASATVSAKVAAGLQQMREEEKLARDVYLESTSSTAATSDVRQHRPVRGPHTVAVKRLLTRYRVRDP